LGIFLPLSTDSGLKDVYSSLTKCLTVDRHTSRSLWACLQDFLGGEMSMGQSSKQVMLENIENKIRSLITERESYRARNEQGLLDQDEVIRLRNIIDVLLPELLKERARITEKRD
jgi:hypothetical protein